MSDLLPIPATTLALIQRAEESSPEPVTHTDMARFVELFREVKTLHDRLRQVMDMGEPPTLKSATVEQLTDELIERVPPFMRDEAREKLHR